MITEQQKFGLFEGADALWDYLNPESHPPTPLVELPENINPYREFGIRIYAKQMQLTPLLNLKSISAFSMMHTARARGDLSDVSSIVESSSMNMALCLSVLARNAGIDASYALIDDNTPKNLVNVLLLFGLSLKTCPYVADPKNDPQPTRVQIAKSFAREIGAFHCGQYSNRANPSGHESVTGPQIWSQLGKRLSVFSATLGTCGTLLGSSQYLKAQKSDIFTLGVVRAHGEKVPGPRTLALLADVEFDWEGAVDDIIDGNERESYSASMQLIRHGLLAGPSSGLGLVGLRRFLDKRIAAGLLDDLRNEDGEVVCTFLCCDTPFLYVDRYLELLSSDFAEPAGQ